MQTKLVLIAIFAGMITIACGALFIQMQANNNPHTTLPVKVACVGDSITESFGYPENLAKILGDRYTVRNFGVGGTTASLDGATPYMYEPAFVESKSFQPNIVVIMLGTNDASPSLQPYNGNFVNDYTALINQYQQLPSKPQIWLVKPPPIFNNGMGLSSLSFDQNIIPKIVEVAQKTGLPLIDLYSELTGRSDCFYDGVHPTEEGAMVIANEVYRAIASK